MVHERGPECGPRPIVCGKKLIQIRLLIRSPSVAGEPGFEPRLTESESLNPPRFHTVFLPTEGKTRRDASMAYGRFPN